MSSYNLQDNPLRKGLRLEHRLEPVTFILFGGSGDLARRKVIPSLYRLAVQKLLPETFSLITVASTDRSHQEYRDLMRNAAREHSPGSFSKETWQRIENRLFYVSSRFDSADGYAKVKALLDEFRLDPLTNGSLIFYLATQPSYFPQIIGRIAEAGLGRTCNYGAQQPRIVIEKPFGRDGQSARTLNGILENAFDEKDIYRIDHYLAKETVQNILAFRFANAIFEPLWNRKYIDHVQITSAESIGIEDRGRYYEEAGAIRDMLQNHILQILSLTAMEPPTSLAAESIAAEKLRVLNAIPPFIMDADVIRGQYGAGTVGGEHTQGYKQEQGISPESKTETFIAARFRIDNPRWQGVPFYIRTGKRLTRRKTEIAIQFKQIPNNIFDEYHPAPNSLVIRIQPDEGISARIESKLPGTDVRLRSVDMDFDYLHAMGALPHEAYEKLLLDCMHGDQTLFAGKQALEAQWSIIDPILHARESSPAPEFPNYRSGSMGPLGATEMIERDGRRWRRI